MCHSQGVRCDDCVTVRACGVMLMSHLLCAVLLCGQLGPESLVVHAHTEQLEGGGGHSKRTHASAAVPLALHAPHAPLGGLRPPPRHSLSNSNNHNERPGGALRKIPSSIRGRDGTPSGVPASGTPPRRRRRCTARRWAPASWPSRSWSGLAPPGVRPRQRHVSTTSASHQRHGSATAVPRQRRARFGVSGGEACAKCRQRRLRPERVRGGRCRRQACPHSVIYCLGATPG